MGKFLNEHLLPGQLGHLFVIISFVAAITATFAYFKMAVARNAPDEQGWRKLARIAFWMQTVAVTGVAICLFYILNNHLYEYKFAYKHSNNALEKKYLISAFWEGQEGSFLVWIFWHCILGLCTMYSSKKWEAPVMGVISFVQIFLTAFLLGLQFGNFHIGSSPFVLLRNSDMGFGPIFQQADYLSRITDGQGLNILLQNRWMVIHPPTLFLGFASCTIPFAYAVAGLWKKDYSGWLKPALPWALVAGCVLGVGILMGAKWAYESLSFGGYWAWDPVENASLVPWLTLIGGIHAMLIYKHTGYSLRSAHLMLVLTFVLVIYSTCLTRTGILGETSVHAFTGAGMQTQLWLILLFTALPPLVLLAMRYIQIPAIKKEESIRSREFWMFIGALIFFLSAAFVIIATSLPVYNKLFGGKVALGENAQAIYNKVHVPIVIILGILIAITQFYRYKDTPKGALIKKIWGPLAIALVFMAAFVFTGGIKYNKQGPAFNFMISIALFAAIFTVTANAAYIIRVVKNNMLNWGGSLAHLGFGLLLVGILVSASNQKIVSLNNPMVNVFGAESKEDPRENLNLIRGVPVTMGNYSVLFNRSEADKRNPSKRYYGVQFTEKNGKTFNLTPTAYLKVKGQEGISPEPDFRSYLGKDVFLYITSLTDPDRASKPADFVEKPMRMGDTAWLMNGYFVVKTQSVDTSGFRKNSPDVGNLGFTLGVEIKLNDGRSFTARPGYYVKNNEVMNPADSVAAAQLQFRVMGVADGGFVRLAVKNDAPVTDYITIKVLEFPMIKLMWIGMIVMSIGFMVAM
ncbi:MAG: cytochrome c biogenesis protein CcsA, partial [Dinghuibacter sp.]|nr:cytochrome c biogenesis protein CcsA [Dinghuibacter sp.]